MLCCLLQDDFGKRDLLHLYLNGFNRGLNLQLRILYSLESVCTRFKALSEWDVKLHVGPPNFYFCIITKGS